MAVQVKWYRWGKGKVPPEIAYGYIGMDDAPRGSWLGVVPGKACDAGVYAPSKPGGPWAWQADSIGPATSQTVSGHKATKRAAIAAATHWLQGHAS